MSDSRRFTCRSARAGALMLAFGAVVIVETAVLHVMLAERHLLIASALTLSSVSLLVWLGFDYHAMGQSALVVEPDAVRVNVGRRAQFRLERSAIASVTRPGWRELPTSGTPEAREFVNLTKPAEPNVLLTLRAPVEIRLAGGLRRTVRRIVLHMDDPDALIAALRAASIEDAAAALTSGESRA